MAENIKMLAVGIFSGQIISVYIYLLIELRISYMAFCVNAHQVLDDFTVFLRKVFMYGKVIYFASITGSYPP